jgi:NhaA family Na+:H+ antiporter
MRDGELPPRVPNERNEGSALREFLTAEAAGGIILVAVAALAIITANSPLAPLYFQTLESYVLGMSVLHWVNDALMALFFLLVGLEIKREVLIGQLRTWPDRVLPGVAALGGMAVPALIYVALNAATPDTVKGWAIPSATDIAFALGVLALLGKRVPISLKIFLTALAIIDDLGAVIIIALFHTAHLSVPMLGASLITLLLLAALSWRGVEALWPYLVLGLLLWIFVHASGIHATIAGVALAFTIPLKNTRREPPLLRLEHALQPWVAFLIVPIFGFANAGISFAGLNASAFTSPVPLGIGLGLFAGKQLGVFGFSAAAIKLRWAELPAHAGWLQLYGVALLCGIGFTMSLFIGLLAFPPAELLQDHVKFGVLSGSLASALLGALVLTFARRETR